MYIRDRVGFLPNANNVGSDIEQGGFVFAEPALKGENAHLWSALTYQPRSANRCGCGIDSTLIPTIAGPRSRETFAMMSGLS